MGKNTMPSSASFLRQLSGKEGWKSASKRWGVGGRGGGGGGGGGGVSLKQMEGLKNIYGNGSEGGGGGGWVVRKRVMVVVDHSSHSKQAMMWALTHVANKGDILTLLHIIPPSQKGTDSNSPYLATSLGSLCKASKPEVCLVMFFKIATSSAYFACYITWGLGGVCLVIFFKNWLIRACTN